jgi:hypothetical protein
VLVTGGNSAAGTSQRGGGDEDSDG